MEPFVRHEGLVAYLDRPHVDTDAIIPKQFLKRIERTGFGQFLFYDWRFLDNGEPNPDFILNAPRFQGASILLARENFGCGSSREHAPWALMDYGFKVIIAPSFADIFFNNSLKNGLLLITLPEDRVDALFRKAQAIEGYRLEVDLENCTLKDQDGAQRFEIDPHQREILLHGLDDISVTLKYEDRIAEYERNRQPWLTPSAS